MQLDESAPDIALPMDRPLFSPPLKPRIDDRISLDDGEPIPADALFGHVHVDKDRLARRIRQALQLQPQISLGELVESNPIEQGLAELVAYFSLAAEDTAAIVDDAQRQTLVFADEAGRWRRASLPLVIFSRARSSATSR
jgi:hypothetical protein